jgi:predicted amidohydrolase
MKICVAQTRPVKGDVPANIAAHHALIDLAVASGAEAVFFPELSMTGYEPWLAAGLAMTADDERFGTFQMLSDDHGLIIGVGAPLKGDDGVRIGMVIFRPGVPREVYCKQHLHADELPFFVNGDGQVYLNEGADKIGLCICYELSVPAHAEQVYLNGAGVYLSSVAETPAGVKRAAVKLAATAMKYGMAVLMSNYIGHCDNFDCGGGSAVWNKKGVLLAQLEDTREGLLIFNTETEEIIEKLL